MKKKFFHSFKSTFQRFVHELSLAQMTTQSQTNTSPSTMNEYSVSDEEIPPPKTISLSSQSDCNNVSTQRNSTIFQRLDLTQNQNQIQKRKHSPIKPNSEESVKKPKSATTIPSTTSLLGKNYIRNNAMNTHECASTNCLPFHSFIH